MACNSQSGLMQLGCCGGVLTYQNRLLRARIGSGFLTGPNPDYYGKYLLCRAFATDYDMDLIPANHRRNVNLDGDGNEAGSFDTALLPSASGILVVEIIFFQASDSTTRVVGSDKFMRIGPSPQPSKIQHVYKPGCDTRYTDFVFQPDIIPPSEPLPVQFWQDDVTYNVLDPACTVVP